MNGETKSEEEVHRLYDLGNLMMVDTKNYENIGEEELVARTSANFQGMLQALVALKEKNAKAPFDYDKPLLEVALPEKMTQFPRQKPLPKAKPLTKWEQFRVMRGLRPRKKRTRFVYDDITKDWVPRYGFKSIKHIQDEANGIVEDDPDAAPGHDPFLQRKHEKKLVLEKQKGRELKNKMVAIKSMKAKSEIGEALKIAQKSTASMGKHDKKANKKERDPKPEREKINLSTWDMRIEKKRNLDILKVVGKRPATEPTAPKDKHERPRKHQKHKNEEATS